MRVKLAKWGNSVAVRLPREACERYGFLPGAEATIGFEATHMALVPAEPVISIDALVESAKQAGGLAKYPHEAVNWGPDMGVERIDD
jgi:antitoxin MazE